MYVHQKITYNMPKGGSAPRNFAAVVRKPRAGVGPMKFSSLKDAMTYIKKQQIEELQDEYENGDN